MVHLQQAHALDQWCIWDITYNMVKKKSSITYLGNPTAIPQQIAAQIPTYEQPGIRYQGNSKVDIGSGKFELRKQRTRWVELLLNNTASGSHLFARPDWNNCKFYCTYAIIKTTAMSVAPVEVSVADVIGTGASIKIIIREIVIREHELQLDFSSCPREFIGQSFDLWSQASLSATQHIEILLYGFEELN
jgi:hypothetical protein